MKKLLLLVLITTVSLNVKAQSKKEVIEELQAQQTMHLAMIDSLKKLNKETSTSYKQLMQKTIDTEEKNTKLSAEVSDLRMTMYEYVAQIDSLSTITQQQARKERELNKKLAACSSKVSYQRPEEAKNTNRIVKEHVHLINISVQEETKVKFKLIIDDDGKVLVAENVAGFTTTTDAVLLKQLKNSVVKQVKYNSDKSKPKEIVYYSFVIKP